MAFLTDRKRATGQGSARTGTEHHWNMTISSSALLVLAPLFVITFGCALGSAYEDVLAYYARPVPAIIAALTIWVGFMHFKNGIAMVIEDYVHGVWREFWLIFTTCMAYGAAATGVFAIAKMAI